MSEVVRPNTFLGNEGLAGAIAKKYKTTSILAWMEEEDIYQTIVVGMLKAEKNFDPKKGVKFSTFAARCAENEILMGIRKMNKLKKTVSLDEEISISNDGSDDDTTRYDLMPDKQPEIIDCITSMDELTRVLNYIFNGFRVKNTVIYLLLLHSRHNQVTVSKLLNISQSYVSRLQSSTKKKLEAYISSPGLIYLRKEVEIKIVDKRIEYNFLKTGKRKYSAIDLDSISETGVSYFWNMLQGGK